MAGQGTIKSGRQGQTGTIVVQVTDGGQPTSEKYTEQSVTIPDTEAMSTVDSGVKVDFQWREGNSPQIEAGNTRDRGRGVVEGEGENSGKYLTVTSAGDTEFKRDDYIEIDLTGTYGDNSGYASHEVYFADVKEKAGYLNISW